MNDPTEQFHTTVLDIAPSQNLSLAQRPGEGPYNWQDQQTAFLGTHYELFSWFSQKQHESLTDSFLAIVGHGFQDELWRWETRFQLHWLQ